MKQTHLTDVANGFFFVTHQNRSFLKRTGTNLMIYEWYHLHFQAVYLFTDLTSKSLCVMTVSLGETFQGDSQNEPAMIGHRTTGGKLLRNMQDRVTMETRPCEVLLRSHPLQSPWRPWQRTEYSNLAWLFTMATQAGPLWRQPWGHFYGDLPGLSLEASSKSPLGGMLYANPAKQLIMKRSMK